MDEMRKAFEAWAEAECGLSAEFFPDGSYTDGRLRSMWEAWQAATLAERERRKEECDRLWAAHRIATAKDLGIIDP